ncbi:hypothetical protein [Collimonas pratensis]|uniref:hypothetical protein n=1 Tax=Collimonas pratensis TaxID=279113 RepID=UPI0012E8EA09|nr:hypothetical protein [Collimonas pratensis]
METVALRLTSVRRHVARCPRRAAGAPPNMLFSSPSEVVGLRIVDHIALVGNRLAVHDVGIRTGGDGIAARSQRIAYDNDMTSHRNRC